MSILDSGAGEAGSDVDLKAEIARLRAENEALQAAKGKGTGTTVTVEGKGITKEYTMNAKPSEKGGVSVYGLGKFPVTHYPLTWLAILDFGEEIREVIAKNADTLSWEKKVS